MYRRRRRRKGDTDPGLRAKTGQSLRQDQDRGQNFANQGEKFNLSGLPHKKQTNVDRDTILSAIEITCMDFDCCNILN